MSILTQKTIKKIVSVSGTGLHTGKSVKLTIHPQAPNCGIIFKRVDIQSPNNEVYPNFQNVTNTLLCTTIENKFNVKVSTIEHLMAALYGLGIDNILGGKTFKEIINQIRANLLEENKELIFFIEDMHVMSGIQKELLDTFVITKNGENGEIVRSTIRTAIASTETFFDLQIEGF